MALVLADRVLETTTTAGSGTISLAGASVGYQGFSTGVGNGNQTYYTIAGQGTSEWEGWGTALKPAHEPICMARKPLSEKTVAENCLKWGTGGINIDESRIETKDNLNGGTKSTSSPKQSTAVPIVTGKQIGRASCRERV